MEEEDVRNEQFKLCLETLTDIPSPSAAVNNSEIKEAMKRDADLPLFQKIESPTPSMEEELRTSSPFEFEARIFISVICVIFFDF